MMIIFRRSNLFRLDARNLSTNTDFLIIWTDQEASSGVSMSRRKVNMVNSSASSHVEINGIHINGKISGFPIVLALSRGSMKGAFLNFLQIVLIVLMKMQSKFGNICW